MPKDGVGLAKGLALAFSHLREHQADGLRVNINSVKKDKASFTDRHVIPFVKRLIIFCALLIRTLCRFFGVFC